MWCTHLNTCTIDGSPGVIYNRSRSGWFDNVCFTDGFTSVGVLYFRRLEGKVVIFGGNLALHFSEEVLKKCKDINLSFVCLPHKSTYMCQHLDVWIFAPLMKYWRDVQTNWNTSDGRLNATLPKE